MGNFSKRVRNTGLRTDPLPEFYGCRCCIIPDIGDAIDRRPRRKVPPGKVSLRSRRIEHRQHVIRWSEAEWQRIAKPEARICPMHVAICDSVAKAPEPAKRS